MRLVIRYFYFEIQAELALSTVNEIIIALSLPSVDSGTVNETSAGEIPP